jgi:hypothetical protein
MVLGVAFLATAPPASAKVIILKGEQSREVDSITEGHCLVSGKKGHRDFFLTAKSKKGKFNLTAFIDDPVWKGFNQYYITYYGGKDPEVFLHRNSDDEVFSNFKLPGTPAGIVGAGAVAFRKHGRKVGIGLYAASNKSHTEGYAFAGAIRCKYRKHRRIR